MSEGSGQELQLSGILNLFWRKPFPWPWRPDRGKISTRARLRAMVDDLDLPPDWTIEEFIAAVERMRGRRIARLPLPPTAPVGLCGLWLACKEYDAIFLRRSPDSTVETHVVLHEIGHMLLGHGQDRPISATEWKTLKETVGDIDPATVRAARGISSYASNEEYEAELFATLIGSHARTDGPRRDPMLKEM